MQKPVQPPSAVNGSPMVLTEHTIEMMAEFYSGPIPHPEILRQIELVAPGAAAKIIQDMIDQSHHRMDLEKATIRGDNWRANMGLVTGFVVAVGGLGISLTLGLTDHDALAGTIATTVITSLAGLFVYGHRTRKKERIQKAEIAAGQPPPSS